MSANAEAKPAVILLVEDDRGDQEITKRALEGGKIRNDLHVVEDGEAALDYLLRRGQYSSSDKAPRPDLVLLDLNLPKVDGRKVLEIIRTTPELKSLVVVIMTTSKQEEDIVRSYQLGANSYITKPVGFEQFARIIKDVGRYWFQIVVLPPK